MTYGVDQCRVCGAAMPTGGTGALERYLKDRKRRPTMSEAEWRAKGFKAAPTRHQLHKPTDGCCFKCRMEMGRKSVHPYRIMAAIAACAIVISGVIFVVGTTFN
jgi:hypothetical protein